MVDYTETSPQRIYAISRIQGVLAAMWMVVAILQLSSGAVFIGGISLLVACFSAGVMGIAYSKYNSLDEQSSVDVYGADVHPTYISGSVREKEIEQLDEELENEREVVLEQ